MDAVQRTMVKNVKIHAPIAIKTVVPTIYGDIEKTSMSPANIMKCLIGRATVWEILSDGSLLKLNSSNYNTVNRPSPKKEEKQPTLASEVERSAIVGEDEATNFKTMILKDHVNLGESAEIDPSTVESLNDKIAEAGEIPAPKKDDQVKVDIPDEDVPLGETDKPEMTDEEKELAEIQAEIDRLDAEEKNG